MLEPVENSIWYENARKLHFQRQPVLSGQIEDGGLVGSWDWVELGINYPLWPGTESDQLSWCSSLLYRTGLVIMSRIFFVFSLYRPQPFWNVGLGSFLNWPALFSAYERKRKCWFLVVQLPQSICPWILTKLNEITQMINIKYQNTIWPGPSWETLDLIL